MGFALLGTLAVADEAGERVVAGVRQRALLACLLARANAPVSYDALIDAAWDGKQPAGSAAMVRSVVTRLRKALGPGLAARIVAHPPGYLIRVGEGELDLLRFEALCQDAAAALRDGAWARACDAAGQAVALWRGAPLLDVPSEVLRGQVVPRLEQLRLQLLEDRAEAELHLGRHEQLVVGLRELAAAHPLRERFQVQLMLALYRCGRHGEALAAYQDARRALVDELGIEPGAELRALHARILAGNDEPVTPVPPADQAPADATAAVPRQLPAAPRHFTGRQGELGLLTGLLRPSQQADLPAGTVVISAIGGMAGVGKTALAVHWAHRAAGRFPDGQLYVNLRGYDPGRPVPPGDALAGLLRSLGVPGQDIPPEQDDRAARYRSLLAGRRMLIVLDNAGSAEQVRPLLPGTGACAVVVTSRDALAGLVARDGAGRLDLDVLPPQDAVALLRTLIGARVDAEPEAAAELADQCGRLPLALRVMAELAASRPAVPLAALAAELADLTARLDLLAAGGDPRTGVPAVFSWSYRHLAAGDARTFRLLGLHPGPDVDPYAAAALTGASVPQARRALDVLARSHLVQPAPPSRYGMHDLLRGYARELTTTLDAEPGQQAALTRLFDYYLHTAAAAMDTLFPAERRQRARIPPPATPVPPLATSAAAREWLDGERAALVAATGHAAACGWPGHATRLATTLSRYLRIGGHLAEARTVLGHALDAARSTGDLAAEATILGRIGEVDWRQGRPQQAADHHRQALALFRAAGDRAGEARALGNLGLPETQLGYYEQAACHEQEALAIFRDLGDRFGEARTVGNLGLARRRQGRYAEAADCYQQSLDLSRELGDREGEAWALGRLGVVDLRLGRRQQAADYLEQALALFQEMGDTAGKSETLVRLGDVYCELGRYEHAARYLEQALAAFREIGDPVQEAAALNGLGDVLFQTGQAEKACANHAAALRLASEADSPLQQARAHSGLARARQADGDSLQARHHWQEALTRYTAIGAPEATEIRARLAGGGDGDTPTEEPNITAPSSRGSL
jgi:DNA-binding SARP family transcriptional activator/tetratricopeptide (TPR) repeat protein